MSAQVEVPIINDLCRDWHDCLEMQAKLACEAHCDIYSICSWRGFASCCISFLSFREQLPVAVFHRTPSFLPWCIGRETLYTTQEKYIFTWTFCLFEAKPTSSLFECLTQTTPWRNCGFYVCVYWLIASLYNKVNLYSARLAAIILRQHHYFALCMKLQLFLKQGKSWKLVQYDMAKHCTSVYAMLCKW